MMIMLLLSLFISIYLSIVLFILLSWCENEIDHLVDCDRYWQRKYLDCEQVQFLVGIQTKKWQWSWYWYHFLSLFTRPILPNPSSTNSGECGWSMGL